MGIGKMPRFRGVSADKKRRRKHKRQVREAGAQVLNERRVELLVTRAREDRERMQYAILEGK